MKTMTRNGWFGSTASGWLAQGSVVLALLLAGCSEKPATETPAEPKDVTKVIIRGSNTFGEELAPRLIADYIKDHATTSFDLETKGTSYGMGALMGGFCDIAGASRLPTKDELEVAQFRNVQFNDYVIGAYSVAVVVNADSPVTNLTEQQVSDIFTGGIQNWKDVGGPDAPIHMYLRDPISGTHLGFKELAMGNKPYASELNMFTNYVGIVDAVAKDPNSIGYSSFELSTNAGVKPVNIGGVAANFAAVNKGEYPYARTLHLYTAKDKETGAAHDFIQYILSARGQAVLTQAGNVPLP